MALPARFCGSRLTSRCRTRHPRLAASRSSRGWPAANQRTMDAAIVGPTPSVVARSASEARRWRRACRTLGRWPRRRRAEALAAERGEQPSATAAACDPSIAATQLLGAHAREALVEREQLLDGERVDVGRVAHETGIAELEDGALAEPLDVHRPARGPVDDPLVALERARRARRSACRPRPRGAPARSAARTGTAAGTPTARCPRVAATAPARRPRGSRRRPCGRPRCRPDARPWPPPGPGCAAWPCRRSSRRRTRARAPRTVWPGPVRPDRHLDVAQDGRAFLGRELERDRPPRGPRGVAQPLRAGRGRRPSPPRRRSRSPGRGGAPASGGRTR
jgi:hypothetical protein